MNKLFSYSRIAAFGVAFLSIIQIVLVFVGGESSLFVSNGLSAVYCVLWIVLFALIVKCSVRNSPLVAPSCIAGAGYVLSIAGIILTAIGYAAISGDSYGYRWFTAANVVNIVAMAATVIGFVWLSRYFLQGSPQKIASYIIPAVIVICFIGPISFFIPWEIWDEPKRMLFMHIRSMIYYVATYGSASFFMFSLSKLKK